MRITRQVFGFEIGNHVVIANPSARITVDHVDDMDGPAGTDTDAGLLVYLPFRRLLQGLAQAQAAAGIAQRPAEGGSRRWTIKTWPSRNTTAPTAITGWSG